MQLSLELNGERRTLECHPGTLLSELLRSLGLEVELIELDGVLVRVDLMLAAQAHSRSLVTVPVETPAGLSS